MTSRARWNRRVWSVMAVAGLGGVGMLSASASAQIAAGQGGGRALDANTQVGSGGNNRVENQIDYAARNDLITGNVAGGFGFQDDVGYSAPGAFLDGLGSDDLFTFRAESLVSSPLVANLPGAGTVRGGNIVVFENFTSIPTGRTANSPTRFAPTGGAFRVNRDSRYSSSLELTLDRSANQTFSNRFDSTPGTNTLGILQIQDGSALAVTADPLAGVRRQALDFDATPTLSLDRSADANDTLGRDPDSRLEGFDAAPQDNLIPTPALNSNNLLLQGSADNNQLLARNGFTDANGLVKPSLQLGQLALNNANASASTLEQRVRQLQNSIFGTDPAAGQDPATPGSDGPDNVYTQLLEEIREQSQQSAADRAAELDREGFDPRPEWMQALDEPSEDEVDAAEGTLEATMQRIRQQAAANRGEDGDGSPAPSDADTTDDDGDAGTAALDELMSDLSYNVRLETLVAAREGRVNNLFAEAEQQMAAGQFLNAERTYRQIRIEAASNPLGLAGLIHAQLGAGMIRSAAFNLRSLFEDHPELIATRYGQALLPSQDRLGWLQKELQRMIDAQSGAIDPGLMMAYLGHQIESRPLVRQGLAIAQNAAPIDPLLPVLRSIWLDQKPGAAFESSK